MVFNRTGLIESETVRLPQGCILSIYPGSGLPYPQFNRGALQLDGDLLLSGDKPYGPSQVFYNCPDRIGFSGSNIGR